MKLIKLRDTRGNESFALRIEYATKDYRPRPSKKVEKNSQGSG